MGPETKKLRNTGLDHLPNFKHVLMVEERIGILIPGTIIFSYLKLYPIICINMYVYM